jgi:hypothetical protein
VGATGSALAQSPPSVVSAQACCGGQGTRDGRSSHRGAIGGLVPVGWVRCGLRA